MSSNFGATKPLPSVFGSLGLPTTSDSQSESQGSMFGHLGISQPQQPPQTTQSDNIFAHLGSSAAQLQGSNPGSQSKPPDSVINPFAPQASTINPFLPPASTIQQQTAPGGDGSGILGASQTQQTPQTFGTSLLAPGQPQQGQPQEQAGKRSLGLNKGPQLVYFDNLLEKGKKKANGADGESGFGELPSLQLGLGDIARRARELGGVGTQTQGGAMADSKAHYLLAASGVNPGTTRRDLNSLNAQSFGASHQQSAVDWDPDTSKYVAQLQQQSTTKMIAEGIDRAHRNFNAFLEEHADINWELQRKKIYEHFGLVSKGRDGSDDGANVSSTGGRGSFGKSSRRGRTANADRHRQTTLNRSIFSDSGLQKSVIGTPGIGSPNATLFADEAEKNGTPAKSIDDRFVREKQNKFAKSVQELNLARLQKASYPMLKEFSNVEGQPGGESPGPLIDAYEALIEIVNDTGTLEGCTKSNIVNERQFAENYLDETANSASSISIRKKIINGSRRCLEKQFFNRLENLITRNPREANLGGIPTTLNKVRAYIRVRAARKDLTPDATELQTLEGDYCWALVFFCLRSGLVTEATDYVTDNAAAFRALDRNFMTYLISYGSTADRRLSRLLQDRINTEFQQRSRIAPENSLDPYRMACYKIIGRCELSKRTIDTISQGTEDWIWLQFSLAREVNRADEVAGDVFGLEEIRETIREIGQRYFSKGQEGMGGYGTYFFLQVLGGMFEQAVGFLYPYSYVSAVHFAIALDYYGLLRVSDFSVSETELLTHNTKGMAQISFGRMLGYYTRDFRSGDVEAAVDYLALIFLNSDIPGTLGRSQASLCHEALRELVLETREFSRLLGDIRSDGTRIKGDIEQRLPLIGLADQEEFLRAVTIQAACVADDNGRISDAVLLYHLAEDYDNVITIINRTLSEAVGVEIGQEQMRLQPLKPRTLTPAINNSLQQQQPPPGSSLSLTSVDDPAVLARNMISLYNANALYYQKILPVNRDSCGILLRLSEVKTKVMAGQWAEALDLIAALNLLPMHTQSSIPAIRQQAQAFNALPPTISRNIGPLLLWTITCIGRERDVLAQGQFGGGANRSRKEIRDQLLSAAQDLMVFAGLIKYRLPERVWEAITRCGGDVGIYHYGI